MNGNKWFHGLVAAVIVGASTALESGVLLTIVAPGEFNLNDGFFRLLISVGVLSGLSGVKAAAAYLKQSPVPPTWNGTDRRE